MKLKRILKIIGGVIVFFTLPSLLFFGFLHLKYNEDLPFGKQGLDADKLAIRMLDALNYEAYKATDYLEWTFKNRHHYKWYKSENRCEVYWKNYSVDLFLNDTSKSKAYHGETLLSGEQATETIQKATDYFNNDSFWLVAPYKVFDEGVERRIVTTKDNKQSLLITYTSGGSTPGDSYLWHFDDNGKPTHYQMWVSILPINGLEASWSDWTTTESGAQLPTFHKLLFLGLEMGEVKGIKSNYSSIKTKCGTKEIKNDNPELIDFPIIIKNCRFNNFESTTIGSPNYTSKYYWKHELYKYENGEKTKINNSQMFNSNIKSIEQMINDESKAHYEQLSRTPELKECLNLIKIKYHTIDEMEISFNENNEIEFQITYEITAACDNIKSSLHIMNLKDIEYLFKVEDFLQ